MADYSEHYHLWSAKSLKPTRRKKNNRQDNNPIEETPKEDTTFHELDIITLQGPF